MSLEDAQNYLLPQQHSFWEWNGEELSIPWIDGLTISFADELALVLDCFRLQGLPRLDLVLLLIAATRDSWSLTDANSLRYRSLVECCTVSKLSVDETSHLIELLNGVRSLSQDVRRDLTARVALCEMCLEGAIPRCTGQDIEIVLSGLRQQLADVPSRAIVYLPSTDFDDWQLDLRSLARGLERFDETKLLHRIKTGLKQPVKPASELLEELSDESFSDAIEARELVETLLNDPELYPIGRLAKNLLAALYRA
jgi:hypothetical protein